MFSLKGQKTYLYDYELAILLGGSDDRRYGWVKRALKKGDLIRLRKGIYLLGNSEELVDSYELAQELLSPSYVSFESALSYHGWIPEAVYTTTSAYIKKGQLIPTPYGSFSYERTPQKQFFLGVERIESNGKVLLMAHPWKAIADLFYVRRKNWEHLRDIVEDLRLEESLLRGSDKNLLLELSESYESPRVRQLTKTLFREVSGWG